MGAQLEIQIIAIIVAIACALPGVFLVLRRMAMMSDAITHTILLGIVLAFFITHSLTSPLLILGATLIGLLTVYLVERLHKTKLMAEDSAIGIVFPFLFSIAIILISRYAGSVHLDIDSVLLGELAFAPFNRLVLFGIDMGPKAMYTMGIILLINVLFIGIFYKELKLITFDGALASALGFSPVLLHYGLMALVSVTTVGAFEAVGSILVIAFMIGPPITAYLLVDDLKKMLILSAIIGGMNALLGYRLAYALDVSIAGSMAVMTGVVFFLVLIFAPRRGLITVISRRGKQRIQFAMITIAFHMYSHEGKDSEEEELGSESMRIHLNWEKSYYQNIITRMLQNQLIDVTKDRYCLTDKGLAFVKEHYEKILGPMH